MSDGLPSEFKPSCPIMGGPESKVAEFSASCPGMGTIRVDTLAGFVQIAHWRLGVCEAARPGFAFGCATADIPQLIEALQAALVRRLN